MERQRTGPLLSIAELRPAPEKKSAESTRQCAHLSLDLMRVEQIISVQPLM